MFNAKAELPQKSVLQIKQDDKFFRRLLSKESSISNPSFRISVSVPFVWESQPGTPKYTFSENTLPPLTPPPSYHINTINSSTKKPKKTSRSSNLFLSLIPRLNLKRIMLSSSSPSSSSSSSSNGSCQVVPMSMFGRRRFLSYGSSSFDFRGENNEGHGCNSPYSVMCFGISRATSSNIGFQGFYN